MSIAQGTGPARGPSNYRNIPSHGRVPIGHLHPMIDLEMLVLTGGQERTEQEFATLLYSEGLTREEVTLMHSSCFAVVDATSA